MSCSGHASDTFGRLEQFIVIFKKDLLRSILDIGLCPYEPSLRLIETTPHPINAIPRTL